MSILLEFIRSIDYGPIANARGTVERHPSFPAHESAIPLFSYQESYAFPRRGPGSHWVGLRERLEKVQGKTGDSNGNLTSIEEFTDLGVQSIAFATLVRSGR